MKTPTPIVDSCEGSADRFGDRDVIPASVARELERELVAARAERDQWRECAEAYRKAREEEAFFDADDRFDALKAQEASK